MSMLLLAALATVQADSATAQADASAACDAATARSMSFTEAAAEGAGGECVSIEGVVVGRLLIEDGRARYRREARENDPSSTGAILGLYSPRSFDQPTRVRVIGRLGNCAAMQRDAQAADRARAADGELTITMLSGYCHYFAGQVIRAASVDELGPARLVRLTADTAGPDLGNLSPLAEGDVRARMEGAAAAFLAAVRSDDRAALATMHGGGPDGRRSQRDVASALAVILEDGASPFAALRGTEGRISTEIFGWREPLWADAGWRQQAARRGETDAIACFSASRDAAALWPIDSKDADNLSGRPYACTRIRIAGEGLDAPARFDTESAPTGLPEPG